MASPVPPASVEDPEIIAGATRTALMTQAPLSPHDSDPTLSESEFDRL